MSQRPRSLTIHVRLHYDDDEEEKEKTPVEGEAGSLGELMTQASRISPYAQGLLVKFAKYITETEEKEGGQSPD